MAVSKTELDKQLIQIRRIAEHREVGAEKKIRKTYQTLLKDLKQFIGVEYAELAKDGKLTYEILAEKQRYARFLEEVQSKIDGIAPEVQKEMQELVSDVYSKSYIGMVEGAKNTSPAALREAFKGVDFVIPEQIKHGVNNDLINKIVLNDVLEKNRKEVIYNLKREINIGLTNGDRVDTMAKRIAKTVDNDYKKSVTVARTETHRVREAGLHDGAKQFDDQLKNGLSGMRMVKIWRTMKDERVRPLRGRGKKPARSGANHVIMEGQAVLMDEKFELSDGTMTTAPGQSGVANQDINCRCVLVYKLMTDAEFYQLTGRHFKEIKAKSIYDYETPVRPKAEDFEDYDELQKARDRYRKEKEEYDSRIDDYVNTQVKNVKPMTVEDLKKWCDDNHVIIYGDLDGIDMRALTTYTKRYESLIKDFPIVDEYHKSANSYLPENFKDLKSPKHENGYDLPFEISYERSASWLAEGTTGMKFGSDFSDYKDVLKADIKQRLDGFNVKRLDTGINGLYDHEFGHQLQQAIESVKIGDNPKIKVEFEHDLEKTVYGKEGMSEYASSNIDELFAEGFSAWYGGEKTEFALAFGEFIGRWL